MWDRIKLCGAATTLLVIAAIACVPAVQDPPKGIEKQTKDSKPAPSTFEVLVQYRDGTKEAEKAAVRKSVDGRLKENLESSSGPRGLEVLIVPKTKKLDSVDRVVSELRRNKAVRIVEPQQTYTKQSARRH